MAPGWSVAVIPLNEDDLREEAPSANKLNIGYVWNIRSNQSPVSPIKRVRGSQIWAFYNSRPIYTSGVCEVIASIRAEQ